MAHTSPPEYKNKEDKAMLFPMIWKKDSDSNLTTYADPFAEMDALMNSFFGRTWNFDDTAPVFSGMKTDVIENDTSYTLEAELPGFNKEDIHVDLKDDNLTISASHDDSSEEKKDGRVIRRERSVRSFKRSFNVSGLTEGDISASYKNGVLTVTVPKKEIAPAVDDVKRIEVTD